jgi:hypothetical protein
MLWPKGLGYSLPVRVRYVLAPLGQYRSTQPPISCRGSDSTRSACPRNACELDDALSDRWASSERCGKTLLLEKRVSLDALSERHLLEEKVGEIRLRSLVRSRV